MPANRLPFVTRVEMRGLIEIMERNSGELLAATTVLCIALDRLADREAAAAALEKDAELVMAKALPTAATDKTLEAFEKRIAFLLAHLRKTV